MKYVSIRKLFTSIHERNCIKMLPCDVEKEWKSDRLTRYFYFYINRQVICVEKVFSLYMVFQIHLVLWIMSHIKTTINVSSLDIHLILILSHLVSFIFCIIWWEYKLSYIILLIWRISINIWKMFIYDQW